MPGKEAGTESQVFERSATRYYVISRINDADTDGGHCNMLLQDLRGYVVAVGKNLSMYKESKGNAGMRLSCNFVNVYTIRYRLYTESQKTTVTLHTITSMHINRFS